MTEIYLKYLNLVSILVWSAKVDSKFVKCLSLWLYKFADVFIILSVITSVFNINI